MNAKLYIIKHLIEIHPLKLPKDLPENPNPLHFFIKVSNITNLEKSIFI